MGVDYHYTVGYGVQLPKSVVDSWEDGGEYLYSVDFPDGLGHVEVGNLMDSEGVCFVVLKRLTHTENLEYMDDTVYFFNDFKVTDEEYNLLLDFVEENLGVPLDLLTYPGFFAAGTIS